jgi:hypothetical protein
MTRLIVAASDATNGSIVRYMLDEFQNLLVLCLTMLVRWASTFGSY